MIYCIYMPKKPDQSGVLGEEPTIRLNGVGEFSAQTSPGEKSALWSRFWEKAYHENSASGARLGGSAGETIRKALIGKDNKKNKIPKKPRRTRKSRGG